MEGLNAVVVWHWFHEYGSNPREGKCWPFHWIQKQTAGDVVVVVVVGAVTKGD